MKEGIVKFVGIIRKIFYAVSVVFIIAFMISLVLACSGYLGFIILTPVLAVAYFVFYAFYQLKISMGTVLGYELSAEVVHLKTRRKTFTYSLERGCRAVKVYKNKFICTFETQDSTDKFTFYRKVAFSKSYEEQFTEDDIRRLYPAFDEAATVVD